MRYPDALETVPLARPPVARVRVPGSKSITNRALVLAALCSREHACTLHGALRSEDTEVMVDCLQRLGFQVEPRWSEAAIVVQRNEGPERIPARQADLFVANSGTTVRFLTAVVSLGQGRYRLDGIPRMRERPIADLLAALQQLGVRAHAEHSNGCPPVIVEANGLAGGPVTIRGDVSSQFLSGLLMAAPFARGRVTVQIDGRCVSWPYVLLTAALMAQLGAQVQSHAAGFTVPAPQRFGRERFDIEPDASGASYFFGAAAITGGEVTVPGLARSLQGDVHFVDLLAHMGCQVTRGGPDLTVRGAPLHGIDADMNDVSDCVMTLAAVACFAEGPTTIRNVAHIRHKETDRLHALTNELRRLGAGVAELADGLRITPRPLHAARVETYNDHRMAMSLALIGLRVPGVVILKPGCVAKTYPEFFADLESLRANESPAL